jgi:glycosyltransferase AcbS
MHILECYIESGGFDYQLIKGGISVYTWNLGRAFREQGHKVSILTAAHGRLDYLRANYSVEELPYCRRYRLPLALDPRVWSTFPERTELELETRAYRLHHQGIDLYFLCNSLLDRYSDTFYPPYESKGKDLGFFKPLAFQVDMVWFIREFFGDEPLTIHAHEPFYQYLLPLAFKDDEHKRMVSTVQSNMPINKKVYRPELEAVLDLLDVSVELQTFEDPPLADDFARCLVQYMPQTHLHYAYPDDYVALYSLLLEYSDAIDFLSAGHLALYTEFADTAFRALFRRLRVHELSQQHHHKMFVGWCAISDQWHAADFAQFTRDESLREFGLDPSLPTFFHNARYAVHHKGQNELVQAARNLLEQGVRCNFILRCLSGNGIADPAYHALAADFSSQVHLEWSNRPERDLMKMAAASDFCVFPSKFEMDTFLIAQGEAMLAGCVPIASKQLGMMHWRHSEAFCDGEEQCTGFEVLRSFLANDEQLTASLEHAIRQAVSLFADAAEYAQRAARAGRRAQDFTWQRSAAAHLGVMQALWQHPRDLRGRHEPLGPLGPPAAASAVAAAAPGAATSANIADDAWRASGELVQLRTWAPGRADLPTLLDRYLNDERHLEYRWRAAVRVDAFTELVSGTFDRRTMIRQGESFTARWPHLPITRPVFLLVTLADGSQFWDGSHSEVSQVPDA